MTRYQSAAAEFIADFTGRTYREMTLRDAVEVERMLENRELHHIEGEFIRALADLADDGAAVYRGLHITNRHGAFVVQDGAASVVSSDAIEALIEVDHHLDPLKRSSLREPAPLDAEIVAGRQDRIRQRIIESGHGHLLGAK